MVERAWITEGTLIRESGSTKSYKSVHTSNSRLINILDRRERYQQSAELARSHPSRHRCLSPPLVDRHTLRCAAPILSDRQAAPIEAPSDKIYHVKEKLKKVLQALHNLGLHSRLQSPGRDEKLSTSKRPTSRLVCIA